MSRSASKGDFDEAFGQEPQAEPTKEATSKKVKTDRYELSNSTSSSDGKGERAGEYAKNIGTGNHAKTNVIFYILSTTFVIFGCITASLIVIHVFGYSVGDLVSEIKDLWMIFTPIITLGLGYLFGTNKNNGDKVENQHTE